MNLSVITPVFNEEEALPAFLKEVDATFGQSGIDLELVFVDDGSTDGTLEWLRDRAEHDRRVRYLSLSRNFGSHYAVTAGLAHAIGDAAVIVAVDLQDPLTTVLEFVARWREGYQVVWGVRESRDDPVLSRALSSFYYSLLRLMAFRTYPKGGTGSFCLIDRKVIDSVNRFTEHNRLTFGIISLVGFRSTSVLYRRQPRLAGRSKWTFWRRLKAAIDSFVAHSFVPIRAISYCGVVMSLASFVGFLYVLVGWAVHGTAVTGWPSLISVMLLISGIQMIMLGVIGEYIWRIAEDVKARPLYIVQETSEDRLNQRPP